MRRAARMDPRAGVGLLLCGAMLLAVPALLAASARAADPPGVLVAEVERVSFPLEIEAVGTTRANESVDIRPLISQRIVAIHLEEAQHAEAGQVLVELQSAEARAEVASAKATLAESEAQLRRAQEIYKTRAVSASELDTRLTRRDADRAALDAARARLADTKVRAPFAGVLGLRRVSLGSYVTPSTVITTLDDISLIKLDFSVPEVFISHLAHGLEVIARSAAFPDRRFEGEVVSIDTRVDPVTRSLAVRALLPNEPALLRPGMFMTVTLVRSDIEALVVPESAIIPDRSRQFVFVVGEGGIASRREVEIGRRAPGRVEVKRGLEEGEVVVVEGTQKARSGAPVRVIEAGRVPS